MTRSNIISPDFPGWRGAAFVGAATESALFARRASLRLVDDFGVVADSPARIADLLLALERTPFGPTVVLARGEYGAADRVRVDHAGEVYLLSPADARLTADALDTEQAFAGCSGVAAQLREAALRIDYGAPPASAPVANDDRAGGTRSGLRTLVAMAGLGAFVLLMLLASFVPVRG